MEAIAAMLEEHRAALSTDFKSAFSTLESKLDTIQSKVEDQERRVLSLESNANAVSESIGALETSCSALANENAKLQAKVLDLEGRSRRNNIRIIGLPESIEGSRPTEFFAGLLVEVLGEQVLTSTPELDRAHRALTSKPSPGEKPRSVVICFHKFQTRDLVIRESRKMRGRLLYRGDPIHIFKDYSPDVLNKRSEFRDVMKELYNLKPALHYPAKLKHEGKKRLFSPQEARELVSSYRRPQPDE
ncbi:hypothetical protein AALO_G00085250 [Alosa alosa]|uniref:LINE-1 type transposase domain-containing 1 n=1 Tax=Alosa alosa TaxID=278164 RepID=A0AAV6H2A3_9TELE|nr:hypothetical protein AALO_G00085250 [Alosa alosa]